MLNKYLFRRCESFLFSKNREGIQKCLRPWQKLFFSNLKMESKEVYGNVRPDITPRRSFTIYLNLQVKTNTVILQLYIGSLYTTCYISKLCNILLL